MGTASYLFFHLGRHRVKSQVDGETTGETSVAGEVTSEVARKVAVEVTDAVDGVTAGTIAGAGQLASVSGGTDEGVGQFAGVDGSVSPGTGKFAGIGGGAGKFEGIAQSTGPTPGIVENVVAVEPQRAAERVRGLEDKAEIQPELRIKIIEVASEITGTVAVQGPDEVTEAVEAAAVSGGALHQAPPASPGRSTTIPGLPTRARAAGALTAPLALRR